MEKKKSGVKRVVKHLKRDIKSFKKEAAEDRKLLKELKPKKRHDPKKKKPSKGKAKIEKVYMNIKKASSTQVLKKGQKSHQGNKRLPSPCLRHAKLAPR